jgi:hypothetical protein
MARVDGRALGNRAVAHPLRDYNVEHVGRRKYQRIYNPIPPQPLSNSNSHSFTRESGKSGPRKFWKKGFLKKKEIKMFLRLSFRSSSF